MSSETLRLGGRTRKGRGPQGRSRARYPQALGDLGALGSKGSSLGFSGFSWFRFSVFFRVWGFENQRIVGMLINGTRRHFFEAKRFSRIERV